VPVPPPKRDPRSEDIVTLQQAADRLGVSPLFLSEVIAEGGFPARRVGRRYFISWPAVMRWVEGVDALGPAAPPRQRVYPERSGRPPTHADSPDDDDPDDVGPDADLDHDDHGPDTPPGDAG